MLTSRQGLTREFMARAKSMGLRVDVPMDGVFNSEVAVIAEAPGEREVAMKVPLVGGSGQFLWQVLKKYGLSRSNVYITNVIKRQVLMSSTTDEREQVPANELDNWVGMLHWELQQLPNVRYILLLGNYALEAMTGHTGITNWRGSVIEGVVGDRKVFFICANNPAAILREPKLEVIFRYDINKLDRCMKGKWQPHLITPLINPSYKEASDWIDKMHDEKLPISFDIEVVSMETACIGLANDNHTGMCINFRDLTSNRYSMVEEMDIRQRFQRLFLDEDVKLVAQNGSFDTYWMWYKDRIQVRRIWLDTLLAHHTLYSQLPHSLGFLTSQYTDHPFYKDEGKSWKEGGNIDQFWEYNVKDCCITRAVSEKLHHELRRDKLEEFFFGHVMRLQPHLVRMTTLGVLIDSELKERIAEDLKEHVAVLREEFFQRVHEATGDDTYNPSPKSWQQMGELYFKRLRLVGRGTSTNEANRKRMMDHPRTNAAAKAVIRAQNEFAKEEKFRSTYAEMVIDDDHRVRCEYKQYGTVSAPGRLSSSKVMWGSGMNLQNQPERAHPMFVADPGYGFGYFDLSQAEARVVGWEARIDKWKEQFEKARIEGGYDCHRALAAEMFHVPYDEVPKVDRWSDKVPSPTGATEGVTMRFVAKRCRHGLNYRMGPDRLAETTGLPSHEAEKAYNLYHRITPELKRWWGDLEQEVLKTKTLYNAFGRRLIILERITLEALESIVAYKPQSLVGDKVCKVIYQSESDDDWPHDARIVLNIHDALICVAPLPKLKHCLRIMKRYAEEPIFIHGEPLIIPADTKMSTPTSWRVHDKEDRHVLEFFPDEHGVHRWYGMKSVEIEL